MSVDSAEQGREFARSHGLEFPLLLADVEMVRRWGLEEDTKEIFRPSTFVLDRAGVVRFAHVGVRSSDRPDLDAVLAVVEELAE